jgi:hypothetical protein
MSLQKIVLKSGVNKENTRYTTEGGYYESEKIRFRQGTPEKIGGWVRTSVNSFLGVCRSLWTWISLSNQNLTGVGTNLKFYAENGGAYYDITPIRDTITLGANPFSTSSGLSTVVVTDATGGFITNDFVTFSGATAVAGLTISGEYQLTFISASTYSITASGTASSNATGGGAAVVAQYQINTGPAYAVPLVGWGAGAWGNGTWGNGGSSTDALRIWNQANFGGSLVYGPRGRGIYYYDPQLGIGTRGVAVTSLTGASDVPIYQNTLMVSDASRFVLVFGTNDIGSTDINPMLIRWSDQESVTNWTPAITNQAGGLPLSHGSFIVTAYQLRQEIVVFTDSAVYGLQYLGAPLVWGSQILADGTSITGPNAAAVANGVLFWMGYDKFYKYDGRIQTLRCDLKQHVFSDINQLQYEQVFAGTNEGFNEIWWFYCSSGLTTIDKYVIYNYLEDIWYYGSMARTAWLDSGLWYYPIAATYSNNLVTHENGVDDNVTGDPQPIEAYITTSEFDIGDGHNFGFVWRLLPDMTFRGSTVDSSPQATMYLYPLQNSGSGYNNPTSVAGSDNGTITRTAIVPVEEFTGQVNIRVRGRQMAFKVGSNKLGTTWQLGSPRIDIRQDGRK